MSETQKGKGLKANVVRVLTQGGIHPDQIRYFADLPGYAHILNNPYSGNDEDALWLAKKFAAKDGFDERFRQWLRRHAASDAAPPAQTREEEFPIPINDDDEIPIDGDDEPASSEFEIED